MRRIDILLLCALFAFFSATVWAGGQGNSRSWQTGTLVETEQSKVLEGTTKNKTVDGSDRGQNSSHHSTTTTSDNYDTFQVYTIDSGNKRYVAREQLLFPWSKPAGATVGEPVKFAVEKNKLYLMGEDGKEHKASVVKVSMKTAE